MHSAALLSPLKNKGNRNSTQLLRQKKSVPNANLYHSQNMLAKQLVGEYATMMKNESAATLI